MKILNQGQGSAFTVRECTESIPRLEKPKNRRFSHKNPKIFDFRFNTPTPFPASGSWKRFHASGMRGIDFSHQITPMGSLVKKIYKILVIFHEKVRKMGIFHKIPLYGT